MIWGGHLIDAYKPVPLLETIHAYAHSGRSCHGLTRPSSTCCWSRYLSCPDGLPTSSSWPPVGIVLHCPSKAVPEYSRAFLGGADHPPRRRPFRDRRPERFHHRGIGWPVCAGLSEGTSARRRLCRASLDQASSCVGNRFLLLISRNWRALFITAITAALCAVVATGVFGFPIWGAFFEAARQAKVFLEAGLYPIHKMTSVYAALFPGSVQARR